MNLINKRFKSIELLNAEIFKEILAVIKIKNSPCFILSGGNSPRYLFENISQYRSYFNQSTFLMSDERIVEIDDSNSNEGEFLRISNIPMRNIISLRERNIISKLKKISCYDLSVLGMGVDGHFASIFPNCKNTSFALNSKQAIISFEDKHLNFMRISLSLNEILKSKKIILIASSYEKQEILKDQAGLPIHQLLKKASNKLSIFNCN